jgi:hypothetical protein
MLFIDPICQDFTFTAWLRSFLHLSASKHPADECDQLKGAGALPPSNTSESGAPLKFRHSFPDICSIAKMTRLQELYLKAVFGRLKWFDILILSFICLRILAHSY